MATAEATYTLTATDADGDTATLDFTITVNAAGAVSVTLDADIAGDDVVNIVERRDGFAIGGTVAATAAVSVIIGDGSARDATVSGTVWSLAIAANDADITGAEVEIVVTATLSGNQDGTVRRTLTVDLTAPTATWTAPATLTVGTAIADIPAAGPSGDILSTGGYATSGLPAGLTIDADTGAISGAPSTANANPTTATITLTDTNGNTGETDLTFPAVDRGSQTLTGFAYSATTATVGQTAPTVTAPTGAVAGSTLSYSANDATICTVDAGTGALTLVGAGACTITVTASATANHNAATADFDIQVNAAGTVSVTLDADIAGDNVVNIVERRDGFTIGGTVAATAAVSVTVGGGSARDATVSGAVWSLAIAANDADITGAEVEIVVTATLSGNQDGTVRRTLTVDLTAPTATWTAPATLTVGTAITDIPAAGPSADIPGANGYAATDLPAGLVINADTGAISGAPTTANANPTTATITLTDTNGNAGETDIPFPAVGRGTQTLAGFAYSTETATVGDTLTLTAPTGAVGALSYGSSDPAICTVDSGTGALSLLTAGACTVTVTAAQTANYNEATASFTITVNAVGAVSVTLNDPIAGDNIVNIAEQRDGFAITGAADAGATVTVTVGGMAITSTATAAADDTWTITVPGNFAGITGASAEVVATASMGTLNNGEARRTLMVDLTAPAATWTAPVTLTVGVAIADIPAAGPSADIPGANGYAATDLPAGLVVNANTGAISGAPTTAGANPATATITLTDTAGNAGETNLTFPAVDRGTQTLTGFAYSATTATVGQTAPTVTAPGGAVAGSTLSYSSSDLAICTVDSGTGALTLLAAGACTITVTAAQTANYNEATASFTITVNAAGAVSVTLNDPIAGDNIVNIAEQRDGFAITGTADAGATVTVTVGGMAITSTATAAADDTWTITVPGNFAGITGASAEVVATASMGVLTDGEARRTLMVDLTAPTATWTAPATLTVGEAITDIPAAGPSADIPGAGGYAATDLPAGLVINANTGAISGAPTTANPNPATATITLTDTNGNAGTVDLTLPAVGRGSQTLTGFIYSATTATVGQTAPTVTAPTGAVAGSTLSYSTSDPAICTVDSGTGALSLLTAGACMITVTAAQTANYNEATASFTITVNAAGAVSVTLNDPIAGDDVVNIVEQRDGFAITGAADAGATVTVTVGGMTVADSATATGGVWTITVPGNFAGITGASAEVVATASMGTLNNGEARRTLTVDLTAPTATWTAPATLTVGVAIADIPAAGPSGDILSTGGYAVSGLPAGLTINANTGAISGAPTTANANPTTATITLTDTAGNEAEIDIPFPAVGRGAQTLAGFAYSTETATVGDTLTLTAPTGAVGALSYGSSDPAICTVDSGTGALSLLTAGACTVTVTAAQTANYNEATASFTITVNAVGAVSVTLDDPIAGDNIVNIAEQRDGFAITGAADAGATVTVTVGGMAITSTATAAADDTWTITVPGNFAGLPAPARKSWRLHPWVP